LIIFNILLKIRIQKIDSFSALVTSDFSRSNGEWNGEEDNAALPVKHDPINKLISIQSDPSGNLQGAYFVAPG
jgi:hypothetical protein